MALSTGDFEVGFDEDRDRVEERTKTLVQESTLDVTVCPGVRVSLTGSQIKLAE